ncbi:exodeoxyribonuclease III [Candidatus Wolfebacteria bacterium CG10_big_fil_rev_8_21_14_0_10_31_9]|uniref:Exodeoxyribonuclease III n=1 Tax=Candidatus Wolfebacteria bacterium CG10_big_fil_rev_8_21_14_0_10_31_9 TaxID=1975070 RepID=A0A2H0RCS5_9BACT|nr:MAG: exodeoxyribonuclease III [Candidatus Wolfebacteria bacterium CG10_big_fil_rev_8_21_14_0_10_31_9]
MKIISWNANGIRSVYSNGFLNWFKKEKSDFVCLQEIKAQEGQIPKEILELKNYYSYFNYAKKKGYSGTAIFTNKKPLKIITKLGLKRFDNEGRLLRLDYKNFTLINVYLPHGGRNKENLKYKIEVYKKLLQYLNKIKTQKILIVGDFNIAHKEIDLARPKQNQNNIMFTLEERKQIDKIIELGFVDTFRKFNKKGENYTWWPYFANARVRNLGWRIDYAFSSQTLSSLIKKAFILEKVVGSDHCPIGIEV